VGLTKVLVFVGQLEHAPPDPTRSWGCA